MIYNLKKNRAAKAQKSRSTVVSLPAPTGGWNARDALSNMGKQDAVAMENWFPATTDVVFRYGQELHNVLQAADTTGNALYISGNPSSLQYASAASVPAFSMTDKVEFIAYIAPDSWPAGNSTSDPVASRSEYGSWILTRTSGTSSPSSLPSYGFGLYTDTSNGKRLRAYAVPGHVFLSPAYDFVDGQPIWVRYYMEGDIGGGRSQCTFYVSNDGETWTLLGSDTYGSTYSIPACSQPLVLGAFVTSDPGAILFQNYSFNGYIFEAQLYNADTSTLAAQFLATDGNIGATSVTSSVTGETYTLVNSCSIVYSTIIPSVTITGTGQVESLMAYGGTSLFAVAGGQIWDVTTQNSPSYSGVTTSSSKWNHINISTAAGSFLYMTDQTGLDAPYTYNGSAWSQPSITGVTPQTLVNINLHKNRVWFVQKDTLKAWYLPAQSIAGAATAFDLTSQCRKGGYLMAMGTWTLDAGYGMDDYAVFITSQGEALVYGGTDPASSATWSLIGVFSIGSPVGKRCLVKYAGDMLLICEDGLVPLSGALQSSRLNPRVSLSDKIQYAMSQAVTSYRQNFGWQVIPFPPENMLVMNVPVSENNVQEQFVMNSITGSWCKFTGWNANCWELFNNELYFGSVDGTVNKAWSGSSDNNVEISGACLQAFGTYGSPGQVKRFNMMRPTFLADGNFQAAVRMNMDFNTNIVNTNYSQFALAGATWDSATWDISLWQDNFVASNNWKGANGVGYYAAPEVSAATSDRHIRWVSTDIVLEPGAIL